MAQVGDLVVTGSSRFLNKINGVCTDGTSGTTKYMRQDGTWQVPPNDNTTYTLDVNGNNIRLKNQGGTVISTVTAPYADSTSSASKLSNWYTSRPTSMNVSFGDGAIRSFKATSSTTTGKPDIGDANIIHLSWDNTGGWDGQIAVGTADGMMYRYQSNGTWQSWRRIIDNQNIGSQSVNYATSAGNAATATNVAWTGVTGKPSTFAPSAHDHSQIVTVGDKRSTATTPNDYGNKIIFQGLKNKATIGSPSTDTYAYLIGLRGWSDSSGGDSHELAFHNTGISWRHGATTTWGNWQQIITSGNYVDYINYTLGVNGTNTVLYNNGSSVSSITVPYASKSSTCDGNAGSATYAKAVEGTYSGNGGVQAPNYFGKNRVGFLMSNVSINSDTHYKNIMYMDCYSGNDVGGTTALAIDRMEAKAWILQADSNRTSWNNSAELITTANIGSQSVNYATSAGTAGNVTGTVAIANGGTGATTRLNALKALTDENVGTNATYFLTITTSWGKGGYSSVANVKTVLGLGSAAYKDASGSWEISVTGSSASCTGNAATATTALIAAKVTATTTNPSSATTYYIPFAAGDGNQPILGNNGLRYYTKEGTTSAAGWGELVLGNSTSTGTAGNKSGWLKLFSEKNGQAEVAYTAAATGNTVHYLPTTGGTLLNTGTTSFTQTLTSGTKIGSIKIDGTSKDLFAPSGVSNIHSGVISSNTAVTVTLTSSNAIGFLARGSNFDVTSQGWFIIINKSIKYYNTLGNSYVRYDDSTNKITFINVNKSNYVIFEL